MTSSRSLSLRYRLALLICGIVLGVVAMYAATGYREERRAEILRSEQRLESVTARIGDMLGASLQQRLAELQRVAAHAAVPASLRGASPAAMQQLKDTLRELRQRNPGVIAVELLDGEGKPVLRSFESSSDTNNLVSWHPEPSSSARSAFISPLTANGGRVTYAIAAPVRDHDRILGWLVAHRRTTTGSAHEQLTALIGSDALLFLANSSGDLWTDLSAPVTPLPLALASRPSRIVRFSQPGKGEWMASVRRVPEAPWALVIAFPTALALQRSKDFLWWQGAAGLAIVLMAGAIAWLLSAQLVRPLTELARAAQALSTGDYSQRVAVTRHDEIGALANAFNHMTARISESRQQLEQQVQALAASETRYRDLFERNPNPMYVYDVDTLRFLAVNDALVKSYGYTAEELRERRITDIRPPEDVPALLDRVADRRRGLVQAGLWRHRRKDGSLVDVDIVTHEITFDGRMARLVVAHDVTAQRRAAESLRSAERRLNEVVTASSAVLYELRIAGPDDARIEWISDNVTRIMGYGVDEALRPGWWTANLHPEDRTRLFSMTPPLLSVDGTLEYRFRYRDGAYRWTRDEQRITGTAGGKAVRLVGAWMDISAQHELESQFRQAQKLEAVGRLAGGVAHDFNNLLTVILAECDIALATPASGDELRTSLTEIRKAGERASMLTRQLLSFSRRHVVSPVELDLNEVVEGLSSMVRRLIGENIECRSRLERDVGLVRADRGQVEQVLLNLVVNGRDAMPEGGRLAIETCSVHLDEDYCHTRPGVSPGEYVQVAVIDKGVGMSAEVRQHLFEPFFTTKEHGKGTGLGLATCYAIMRQCGGHIDVQSEPGAGTTMRLFFPRLAGSVPVSAEHDDAWESSGTETILIVEDEIPVRAVAARMLSARGYTVLEASTGNEALTLLGDYTQPVHLLLTDVVLPGMGGRELAERVGVLRPGIATLFMSGYTDDVILQHQLIERDSMLLQKPFTTRALTWQVRAALDGAASDRRPRDAERV